MEIGLPPVNCARWNWKKARLARNEAFQEYLEGWNRNLESLVYSAGDYRLRTGGEERATTGKLTILLVAAGVLAGGCWYGG